MNRTLKWREDPNILSVWFSIFWGDFFIVDPSFNSSELLIADLYWLWYSDEPLCDFVESKIIKLWYLRGSSDSSLEWGFISLFLRSTSEFSIGFSFNWSWLAFNEFCLEKLSSIGLDWGNLLSATLLKKNKKIKIYI